KAVKATIRRLVGKFRRKKGADVPPQAKPRRRRLRSVQLLPSRERTGQTVFQAYPLRLQSFTVAEPDYPTLQNPGTIEGGAFKIRIPQSNGALRRHPAPRGRG